jgi:hypothetical protein
VVLIPPISYQIANFNFLRRSFLKFFSSHYQSKLVRTPHTPCKVLVMKGSGAYVEWQEQLKWTSYKTLGSAAAAANI